MPSIERNIRTGLQFWFWLLIMSILIVPIAAIIYLLAVGGLSIAGTLGAGWLLVIAALGVAEFVLTLWIYGYIINTKVKRA
jgi:hypothetical protein